MNQIASVSHTAIPENQARKEIGRLQKEYSSWHREHSRWLDDLREWQHEQGRLEALIYKLEHILEDEEREFEGLMDTIETHENLLRTHEKTIEFYLQGEQIKAESMQAIINAHKRQKAWEEKLRELHDHLKELHTKVMGDLQKIIQR